MSFNDNIMFDSHRSISSKLSSSPWSTLLPLNKQKTNNIERSMQTRTSILSMIILIIFLLLFPCGQWSANGQNNNDQNICRKHFAKFSSDHTACLKPNSYCKITKQGITKQEQRLILDVHNYYRNLIASGNESRLGFPSAANMLTLEWDDELAYVAQKHANQCKFEHDCYDCRRTERYPVVGQNLYTYSTTRTTAEPKWQDIIKEWYEEIKIAPPQVAHSFDLFQLNIGHFTQIAWAETNKIGCGYSTYTSNGNSLFKTTQLYTCNYAPGGNYLGEKMYENGASASKCPPKYSPSRHFPSLCEFISSSSSSSWTSSSTTSTSSSNNVELSPPTSAIGRTNDIVTTTLRTTSRATSTRTNYNRNNHSRQNNNSETRITTTTTTTTTNRSNRNRYNNRNNNGNRNNNNNQQQSNPRWSPRLNNWKNNSNNNSNNQPTSHASSTNNWKWNSTGYDWKKWLTNYTTFTNWTQWSKPSSRSIITTSNNLNTNIQVDPSTAPIVHTNNRSTLNNNNNVPWRLSNITWWSNWTTTSNIQPKQRITTRLPTYTWSLSLGYQRANETNNYSNNYTPYNWSRSIDLTPNNQVNNLYYRNYPNRYQNNYF